MFWGQNCLHVGLHHFLLNCRTGAVVVPGTTVPEEVTCVYEGDSQVVRLYTLIILTFCDDLSTQVEPIQLFLHNDMTTLPAIRLECH